ncbi:MAG: phage tape measure protein [Eubacterium sp.]|nr:phage tape measure protein [Eubacterium sp.]
MGRDISIAITVKDNYSQVISTMRNANQVFTKDLAELTSKLDAISKKKHTLNFDVSKAKGALKEAEKQFQATGAAADKLKLEMANAKYDNARRNLDLVSKNARQAEKDIRSLEQTTSKADNKAGKGKSETLGKLASGLTQQAGGALIGAAGTFVNSAYGSEAGTMFSSVAAATLAGADTGAVAGPIGIAVGAAVGGLTGAISGATKNFEKKDDAFKQYYKDQYYRVQEGQSNDLKSGIAIAASRETDKVAFSTLLGGDKNASDYLKQVSELAIKSPFKYDDLTNISKTLLKQGNKKDGILTLLENVGYLGSTRGMSSENMTLLATSLGSIKSKGKVTQEDLDPLLKNGINVWEYLSRASWASEKTAKQVQEMVYNGLIPGEKVAQAIAENLGKDFSGGIGKYGNTYSELVSNVEEAKNEINEAMGEGYTEERKNGLEKELGFLSGESGAKMQEAYKQIGMYKASLENKSEEYQRDAMNAVMYGGDYISKFGDDKVKARLTQMHKEYKQYIPGGKGEGEIKGALFAESQAIAQNEYNAKEGHAALETNLALAQNIKNDAGLKKAYWDAGYQMGIQFSHGLESLPGSFTDNLQKTISRISKQYDINSYLNKDFSTIGKEQNPNSKYNAYGSGNKLFDNFPSAFKGEFTNRNNGAIIPVLDGSKKHAYGLSYVPYDNFPAILHEGERVLTASQNRVYGQSSAPIITGNSFTIREEADVQRIAAELVRQMNKAYELAY